MNLVFCFRHVRAFSALTLAALAFVVSAHASLVVYEGFNGYTAGTRLDLYAPNANTIGLNQTVTYYDRVTDPRSANYTVRATSLEFGGLATSGGALNFSSGTNVIGAKLALATTPFTGTLWSSYLVNIASQRTNPAVSGDGAVIRIGNAPDDTATSRFNSWSDSRSGVSNKLAVGYNNTGTDAPTGELTLGVTYLIINKFTNVGGTGAATATSWALTLEQFDTFLENGGTEAGLTSFTAKATSSGTSATFATGNALSMVTVGDVGIYDELRFATSLADVTPTVVPEPATTAMLVGIACGALHVMRRRPSRPRLA